MAVIAVIVGWWLSQQRLTAKPWLEEGPITDFPGTGAMTLPAAKIGLGVFLAVAGSLFALFISAAHGLHPMGGLVALGRTTAKVWRGAEMTQLRLSVELCAIYWHFLLLVWVVLLGLLTGWTENFVDICRQLLS